MVTLGVPCDLAMDACLQVQCRGVTPDSEGRLGVELSLRKTRMKKSRFSEEKISILREADAGVKVAELIRKHRISALTSYQWKASMEALTSLSFEG